LLLAIALFGVARKIPSEASDPPSSPTQAKALPTPAPVATVAQGQLPIRPVSKWAPSTRSATVDIQIENQLPQAKVTIWVDDQAVFHRRLQGASKKKLGIFGGAHNQESEKVKIAAGQHQLRVRVQCRDPFYDQSHALAGNFPMGAEHILRVSFDKHNEMHASLK
jgi:hypothetical protein